MNITQALAALRALDDAQLNFGEVIDAIEAEIARVHGLAGEWIDAKQYRAVAKERDLLRNRADRAEAALETERVVNAKLQQNLDQKAVELSTARKLATEADSDRVVLRKLLDEEKANNAMLRAHLQQAQNRATDMSF